MKSFLSNLIVVTFFVGWSANNASCTCYACDDFAIYDDKFWKYVSTPYCTRWGGVVNLLKDNTYTAGFLRMVSPLVPQFVTQIFATEPCIPLHSFVYPRRLGNSLPQKLCCS